MPISRKYQRSKDLQKQEHGRKISRIRWDRENKRIDENPPPLSDAARVDKHLSDRRGKISHVIDIAEQRTKTVDTWVLRFSEKGRVDQFDLYKNGQFVLIGGWKKCAKEMIPEYYPIIRYDF